MCVFKLKRVLTLLSLIVIVARALILSVCVCNQFYCVVEFGVGGRGGAKRLREAALMNPG